MLSIKKLEQFFERDSTNDFFSPLALENLYGAVSQYCALNEGVPDDVREYFSVLLTLYIYGWLYYPFYTLASERCFFAVEMGLRKRLPPKKLEKKSRDRRSLRDLLKEANDAGLLRDRKFSTLSNRRGNATKGDHDLAEIVGCELEPDSLIPCVDALMDTSAPLRNRFAHPDMQSLSTPGQALDELVRASEIINQLWPASASK